jgi:hypothetical protein
MNEYKYQVICTYDMSIISGVKDLVDDLNTSMKDFGYDERIGIFGEISVGTITLDVEPTAEAFENMKQIIQKNFDKSDHMRKFKIRSFKKI